MSAITENNYVDKAEQVILEIRTEKDKLTTSKIRNLMAMSAEIYNDVNMLTSDTLTNDLKSRIDYLRVRYIYEAGREAAVKNLVTKGEILDLLRESKTKQKYIMFYHYMESLVAFHKFYGGRD